MVTLARRAERAPFAPVVAVMFGLVGAILVAAVPVWMFERAVVQSGLPTVLAVAAPPLGLTARILAMLVVTAMAGAATWLLMTPVSRWIERDRRARTPWRDEGYFSFDAPMPDIETRRRPVFAPDELGAPLMSDAAIAPPLLSLECELEAAISATLHAAAPTAPMPSVEGEDTTIHGLIRRLESGLARRGINEPESESLNSTPFPLSTDWIVAELPDDPANVSRNGSDLKQVLGELRRLATR